MASMLFSWMRDFKYRDLVQGPAGWIEMMASFRNVRSDCLRDCAAAFEANMARTGAFALMPAEIAYQVRRDSLFVSNARFRAHGKGESTIYDLMDSEMTPEIAHELEEQKKAFRPDKEELRRFKSIIGMEYIEALARKLRGMELSLDATFSSVIFESWTAFECFASDAWVAAVDCGPKEVALRLALSNKLLRTADNITPKELHQLEFDPRTNFGSSMRELGRVSFQRLSHIARFYSIAFEHDFSRMFTDLEDGYLQALSSLRNVLIHKAGRADKDFVAQVQRFTDLREIKPGDLIQLNGELVWKLRAAAGVVALAVRDYLDDLLTPPV
jgi:hypothetical protein